MDDPQEAVAYDIVSTFPMPALRIIARLRITVSVVKHTQPVGREFSEARKWLVKRFTLFSCRWYEHD